MHQEHPPPFTTQVPAARERRRADCFSLLGNVIITLAESEAGWPAGRTWGSAKHLRLLASDIIGSLWRSCEVVVGGILYLANGALQSVVFRGYSIPCLPPSPSLLVVSAARPPLCWFSILAMLQVIQVIVMGRTCYRDQPEN